MSLDIIVGVIGTAAAVGIGAWPRIAPLLRLLPKPTVPASGAAITYQAALEALAVVRSRLVAAGGVGDDAGKAIETLTLALVAGSDK